MSADSDANQSYLPEDWWAIVGPSPQPNTSVFDYVVHDKTRRLVAGQTIAGLHLTSPATPFIEHTRSEPISLEGITQDESWPILVEGKTPASVHLEHDVATARRVVKIAVLLSIAWGEPWVVRSAPFRSAQIKPNIPEPWPYPPGMEVEEPWSLRMIASDPDNYQPEILPEWISRAWTLSDEDPKIWGAALTWNEGHLLQARHPSFAVVAFVSALEALTFSKIAQNRLGLSIEDDMKSRERVRTILRLELGGKDAERIINVIYNSRSRAAHGAKLQGFESSLGAWSAVTVRREEIEGSMIPVMHSDPDDKVHKFLTEVVQPLGSAAHALVYRVLTAIQ